MKTPAHFLWLLLLIGGQQIRAMYSPTKRGNNTISYHITLDSDKPKFAKVDFSFVPKDSILYMTQGANQLPNRWATFVHGIKAVDVHGKSISLTPLADAQWKLPTGLRERITVSYELHLDHAEHQWGGGLDGVAYTTEWGVFYTTRALLIFHADGWEKITVDFTLPRDWKISTPWKKKKGRPGAYSVQNQSALMQAMLFAGSHEELSFKRDGFELIFALGGEGVLAEKEAYRKMASGVLEYYIDLMGGLPNPSPDNVLDKSVVIINTADTTDGEVIGNNISILVQRDGDAMSKMISKFIFAHEFFHLWNAKSFTPEDEETEWFKEGFSNYYTLKALRHVGFLDDAGFLGVLDSFFYQRYTADDGVGTLSMTQGAEKHAHWGLIYGGGLFVGISQDMIIRSASGNTKSLDDLMKGLFQRYGGTHDRYTIDDLQFGLSELSGKDQSEFFKNYIMGTKPVPVAEFLQLGGLEAKVEDNHLLISKKVSTTPLEDAILQGFLGKLKAD